MKKRSCLFRGFDVLEGDSCKSSCDSTMDEDEEHDSVELQDDGD
jgi:hypothetical protein